MPSNPALALCHCAVPSCCANEPCCHIRAISYRWQLYHRVMLSNCDIAPCNRAVPARCAVTSCHVPLPSVSSRHDLKSCHCIVPTCRAIVLCRHIMSYQTTAHRVILLCCRIHAIASSYRAVPSHRAVILCYIIPLPSVFGTHAVAIAFAS